MLIRETIQKRYFWKVEKERDYEKIKEKYKYFYHNDNNGNSVCRMRKSGGRTAR